jgi:hypothetical protein
MYPTSGESSPLWLMLGQMGAGLSCATTVWLTFAAPAFYKKRILGAVQTQSPEAQL